MVLRIAESREEGGPCQWMDNWMAPRAFAAGGNNGKVARQGKGAVVQVGAQVEGADESGAGSTAATSPMGMLKRKRTSPPESPAPSKKRALEGSADPSWPPSSAKESPEAAGKSQVGKSRAACGNSRVIKQLLGQEAIAGVVCSEEAVRSGAEKDGDDLKSRLPASLENVSHGQGTSFQAWRSNETSGPLMATAVVESSGRSSAETHRIPSHSGWFEWNRIHRLERLGLPEYFSGKNNLKTPEIYLEQRNCIVMKYRENPQKLMKVEDVQGLVKGDVSGAPRLFGFLDHWGLINYQATSDFSPLQAAQAPLGTVEETENGVLRLNPLTKPALANLFQFEAPLTPQAPVPKQPSGPLDSASNLPLSSLADALVQESLAAPAVEYHCNSCQTDCSKRRYHCQKQADFDLCPDCYSDGKFGQGMTSTDFLRMDALTETADANGGGWSDQETLLLLEALELYGENWNEIAEHVATKSKAQCILHFIRLPIEDPFLEDMEAPNPGIAAQPPETAVTGANGAAHTNNIDTEAHNLKIENSLVGEAKDSLSEKFSHDASLSTQIENDTKMQATEKNALTPTSEIERDAIAGRLSGSSEAEESSIAQSLLAVAECAGCAGPDGLIAFADAGNPVMAQVAFLAAMVGPRVAAAAAQAALKSLAEEDPVGYLSARNSFALDFSEKKDSILVSGNPERHPGQQAAPNQSVASTGVPTESDSRAGLMTTEVERKIVKVVEMGDEGGVPRSQESEENILSKTLVTGQEAPSLVKVRNAAASALASAAVKAKLLADQEEREIQCLVAGVIDNQLKKLELKLKHFSELEAMLGKECEQAEKARAKVYSERARIVASRLGSTPTSQVQSVGTPPVPSTKPLSHSGIAVAPPRPAIFTFGPTGVSAPATSQKTLLGPETTTPLPASSSSLQVVGPQRLPRPVPASNMVLGIKQ